MMISKKEFLGKTRSSETGLYDWGRGQGRVKMIRAVEAGIEIDGKAAVGGFPWKWLRISSDQDHLAQSFCPQLSCLPLEELLAQKTEDNICHCLKKRRCKCID